MAKLSEAQRKVLEVLASQNPNEKKYDTHYICEYRKNSYVSWFLGWETPKMERSDLSIDFVRGLLYEGYIEKSHDYGGGLIHYHITEQGRAALEGKER